MAFKDNLKIIREFRAKKKAQVAKCLEIGRQNLTNWEAGPNEPGSDILDKLSNCLDVPRELFYMKDLTKEYLEKNFKSVNHTPMPKPNENNGNGYDAKETFYRELVENNPNYSLVPKSVLAIVSEIEANSKKEAESNDKKWQDLLDAKDALIEQLQEWNAELRAEKAAPTKKAKQ